MMIRKVVVLCMLLVWAVSAVAQAQTQSQTRSRRSKVKVEWGVLGGLNFADFSTSMDHTEVKDKLGWQIGMITAVNFGAVAIEPQIIFVHQGLRVQHEGTPEVRLRSSSIDVPVLFSLRILRPLRFNIGPVFTVMNDCKEKSGDDLLNVGRVRPTVSYTIGVGVTVLRHLLIDVRYNGQFNSVRNTFATQDLSVDLRSYNVAFSVGYIF
ncbi:MAG: porin family protein [Alistipes sp.]